MMKKTFQLRLIAIIILVAFGLTGCTFIFQKGRRSDLEKISRLKSELSELERAQAELEDKLRQEIEDQLVKVQMLERGLVITLVAEVLFDSGKAELKTASLGTLSKVSNVLNTTVKDLNVGIEGHTDNEPIKRSGWKSNWELSSARALSVLHYLVDSAGVAPVRLSGIAYGEYHPIADNGTKEGRRKNRRVEIVIQPKATQAKGQEPNLK